MILIILFLLLVLVIVAAGTGAALESGDSEARFIGVLLCMAVVLGIILTVGSLSEFKPSDFKQAEKLCESNGGLVGDRLSRLHDIKCKNGASFNWPKEATK